MKLHITDPEAHRLAAALSQATGETITHVVIEALRQQHTRLQAQQDKATVEELLAIGQRASAQVQRPYLDHAELLYDEHGLPK